MKPDLVITLPVPDPRLNPNGRTHPLQKATVSKAHRQAAFFATLEALGCPTVPKRITLRDKQRLGLSGPMTSANYQKLARLLWTGHRPQIGTYSIRAIYPTERRRDDDNLEGLCKAYRDGIADALLIDDSTLRVANKFLGVNPQAPRFEFHLFAPCQTEAQLPL